MENSMDRLLRPNSVAIIGVSRDAGRKGAVGGSAVLQNLIRFNYPGTIYVVHPQADEIESLPAFRSVADLPAVPDLVIVALPAGRIPEITEACGRKGVKAMVIMAAGFAELGSGEGARLEAATRDIAVRYGIRICGPNGIGYINVPDQVFAGNFPSLGAVTPRAGGLAIISHSGAVGSSLLARAVDRGVGFSFLVSSGNETTVTLADYLDYLIDDESTRVIGLYLEGVPDGLAFRRALERARSIGKPVVCYKVGKSEAGAEAALSHTAKVAGKYALYRGLFHQCGVIEAERLDDLIEIPGLLMKARLATGAAPPRNIGIVTISGGLGAIVTDHLADHGFEVPKLGPRTQERLAAFPLAFGSTANPVDTTAAIQQNEDALSEIITVVAEDPEIDAMVVPNASRSPQAAPATARRFIELGRRLPKPLVSMWYAGSDNGEAIAVLQGSEAVANFDDPATCARALAALSQVRRAALSRDEPMVAVSAKARASWSGRPLAAGALSEAAGKEILRHYGVPLVDERLARDPNEAATMAGQIGFPVALKVVSAQVPHKARAGGVRLGLASADEVRAAYDGMRADVLHHVPEAVIDGALVSEMVAPVLELLVGSYHDDAFGPALVVGLGGGRVEELQDVAICPLPVRSSDCRRMLAEIGDRRAALALAPCMDDVLSVVETIAALAWDLQPRLAELDVNPVAVTADGRVVALDSMMVFAAETDKDVVGAAD